MHSEGIKVLQFENNEIQQNNNKTSQYIPFFHFDPSNEMKEEIKEKQNQQDYIFCIKRASICNYLFPQKEYLKNFLLFLFIICLSSFEEFSDFIFLSIIIWSSSFIIFGIFVCSSGN